MEYPPLKRDRKEFRLLKIRPPVLSTFSQSLRSIPIECDLFVASRVDPPEYLALSYTWGDPNRVEPIRVNGCARDVTLNLRIALEHIRQAHKDVVIWVDAICIDQTNNEEKSDQVQIMTEIYASAKCTIVWLGPAEDGSDEIIEKCNQIGEKLAGPKTTDGMDLPSLTDLVSELNVVPTETPAGLKRSHTLIEQIDERVEKLVDEAYQDVRGTIATLNTLEKLLSRDYWTRVWVHQEFVVSKDIVIQCGNSSIEVEKFRDARIYYTEFQGKVAKRLAENSRDLFKSSSPTIKAKISRWILDQQPKSNSDPNLAEYKANLSLFNELCKCQTPPAAILGMRRSYQLSRTGNRHYSFTLIAILSSVFKDKTANATQARDRIYGMLGMANDKEELGLVPNYDEAISDVTVYTDAARAMMKAGRVDLLSLSQHRQHPEKGTTFPSWVPDWSKPIVRERGHETFAVSGNIPFKLSPTFTNCLPGQMELLGWTVDTIETVLPAWIDPGIQGGKIYPETTDTFLSDIKALCLASAAKLKVSGHDIYTRAVDRETAHFRIPIADQEQNDSGSVRRASNYSRDGYKWVNKSLSEILEKQGLDAMNAQSMKCQKYLIVMRHQKSRLPFLSVLGYVGLAPEYVELGDVLVVFCGAKFPYVLRGNGDGTYRFVGEAYVHGIMDGEFVKTAREMEKFVLQ